jgi:hypothetical protein
VGGVPAGLARGSTFVDRCAARALFRARDQTSERRKRGRRGRTARARGGGQIGAQRGICCVTRDAGCPRPASYASDGHAPESTTAFTRRSRRIARTVTERRSPLQTETTITYGPSLCELANRCFSVVVLQQRRSVAVRGILSSHPCKCCSRTSSDHETGEQIPCRCAPRDDTAMLLGTHIAPGHAPHPSWSRTSQLAVLPRLPRFRSSRFVHAQPGSAARTPFRTQCTVAARTPFRIQRVAAVSRSFEPHLPALYFRGHPAFEPAGRIP